MLTIICESHQYEKYVIEFSGSIPIFFRQYCHDAKLYDMVHLQNESYNLMLMGMTLCHSVQYTSGHFVASSPDEQAIVEACSR